MYLREARISEISSFLIALPCRRTVAVHGVRRKEISIAVSSGSEDNRMRAESFNLSGHKISCDDSLGFSVYEYQIEHFMARIAFDSSGSNLSVQRCISSEKKLLSCLTAGIESTAHLSASERTVGQKSAILPGKRNSLCHTLVDDISAHFSKTIYICLTAAIVTTLDGLIEKSVNGIVVILIVLCSVDTSLGCD